MRNTWLERRFERLDSRTLHEERLLDLVEELSDLIDQWVNEKSDPPRPEDIPGHVPGALQVLAVDPQGEWRLVEVGGCV